MTKLNVGPDALGVNLRELIKAAYPRCPAWLLVQIYENPYFFLIPSRVERDSWSHMLSAYGVLHEVVGSTIRVQLPINMVIASLKRLQLKATSANIAAKVAVLTEV